MIKRIQTPIVIALLLSLAGAGCAHKPASPATGSSGSSEEFGPPLPPGGLVNGETPKEEPVGPMPTSDFVPPKDGVVLVLGPGLARTLAYVGVLRELDAKSIPVRAIVGVEMGAVLAGIWASSNQNTLEWETHKLKRDTLLDFPLLSLRTKEAEGKRLYEFLEHSLKVDNLSKMKVPVMVASSVHGEDGVLIESNGSAKDVLRGAMGIPGLIRPYSWEGKDRETAALGTPFPSEQAHALSLGKVVCVDVLGRGDNYAPKDQLEEQLSTLMRSVSFNARQQLKGCDGVISIAADGVSYLGFDAKADLINKGRLATRKWLESSK